LKKSEKSWFISLSVYVNIAIRWVKKYLQLDSKTNEYIVVE